MGSFSARFSARVFDLVVETSVVGQNHSTLKTSLQVVAKIVQASSYDSWDTTAARSWTVTINGVSRSGTFTYDFRNYNELVLGTWVMQDGEAVTHDADGTKTISVYATVPSGGIIGSATINTTEALPRLDVVPNAATSVAVSRISDTSHTVTWTVNATTARPVRSQQVRRRRKTNGVWGAKSAVGSIPNGTTGSFTDNTTEPDADYEYSIVEVNFAGSTESAAARIQTTPVPPSAIAAVKSGSDINVTVTPASTIADCTLALEHSTNGGSTWAALATLLAGTTTYTHVGPNAALPHTYRVRSVTPTNGRTSTWLVSAAVQLTTPPNAATALSPSGVALAANGVAVCTWQHNPVDTTPQTKYQLRHRLVGASTWTEQAAVTSAVSQGSIAANTYTSVANVEWQVRTWGAHATAGPYSATATIIMSVRPTVAISSPDTEITTSTVTAVWSFFSAAGQTQAEWRARLKSGSTILESLTGTGATNTATFARPALDGETLAVEVEVKDSQGLWSVADVSVFTVDYLPPAPVTLTAQWDQLTGRMYLDAVPDFPESGVTDAVSTLTIERRINGGQWVILMTGLPADVYTFDPLPKTTGTNEYRVLAFTALGASAINDIVAVTVDERQYCYLNWGPGMSEVARVWANFTYDVEASNERELVQLAVGDYPTLLTGKSKALKVAVKATLEWLTSAPVERWEEAGSAHTMQAWRDVSGRHIERGSIAGVSLSQQWEPLASLAFTIERIR